MKLNSSGVSHMHLFWQNNYGRRSNVVIAYVNNHIPINDTYWTDISMWSAISSSWYWTWKHCVYVHDGTSNNLYIDGVLYGNGYGNLNIVSWYHKYIGRTYSSSETTNLWYWISKVIIEDRVWTAQEIADYFDQTKWDYWIS